MSIAGSILQIAGRFKGDPCLTQGFKQGDLKKALSRSHRELHCHKDDI